uniref:Uncharacterized protein n=1 Tax=Pinguiococcus pyrenoidosus TaxID=172671 RepID=A0A7R9UCP8_9STRA|eukprot:scaffold1085_cov252-Pinguiococcus_pyrenoidosus.AAC.22
MPQKQSGAEIFNQSSTSSAFVAALLLVIYARHVDEARKEDGGHCQAPGSLCCSKSGSVTNLAECLLEHFHRRHRDCDGRSEEEHPRARASPEAGEAFLPVDLSQAVQHP